MEKPGIDDFDRQILEILSENSRTPFRQIAKQIGMSAPATIERIAKMEGSGLIAGYTLSLDRVVLGRSMQAFLRIATARGKVPYLLEKIADSPEVEECHKVTGEDSYVLKISVPSVRALEALIERLAEIGTVHTSLILSSPIPFRSPLPPQ